MKRSHPGCNILLSVWTRNLLTSWRPIICICLKQACNYGLLQAWIDKHKLSASGPVLFTTVCVCVCVCVYMGTDLLQPVSPLSLTLTVRHYLILFHRPNHISVWDLLEINAVSQHLLWEDITEESDNQADLSFPTQEYKTAITIQYHAGPR